MGAASPGSRYSLGKCSSSPPFWGMQAGPAPVPVAPGLPAGRDGRWDPLGCSGMQSRSCPTAPHLYLCVCTVEPWRGEKGGGEGSKVLGRASEMLILLLVLVLSELRPIPALSWLPTPLWVNLTGVCEAPSAPCASQTAGDRDTGGHRESKMSSKLWEGRNSLPVPEMQPALGRCTPKCRSQGWAQTFSGHTPVLGDRTALLCHTLDMQPLKPLGFVFLWIELQGAKAVDLSRGGMHKFHLP